MADDASKPADKKPESNRVRERLANSIVLYSLAATGVLAILAIYFNQQPNASLPWFFR
jgi:hypothetical protein